MNRIIMLLLAIGIKQPNPTNAAYTVRLSGGSSNSSGRVEVSNGFQWGTVCDDNWDNNDATVVCKMLGFRHGVAHKDAYYGQGTGKILMDYVNCTGTETSLFNCLYSGWGVKYCVHRKDASVDCYNRARDIRLVGGNSSKEGRVEVFNGNGWGTICDSTWHSLDATAVCRMLGFRFGIPYNDAFFGPGTLNILMDKVSCRAADESIFNCPFGGWGVSSCSHTDDASVKCSNVTDIHLVGGNSSSVGRVEVFNGQEWGTICDLSWDKADATVACKMLGYKYGFPYQNAFYGQGKGNISMAYVNCLGSEESLFSCRYNSWSVYKYRCGHAHDASVECSNATDIHVRLVGGNVPSAGRVEVSNGHRWGTLCDDRWESRDAKVVCKMLGYRYGFPYLDAYYGEGNGTMLMEYLICGGYEQSVFDCFYINWVRQDGCLHDDDASVECSNVTDIRLVDGHSASAGRVEVYNGHRWGTVSDNSWDSNDAKVVCKMIGYKYWFPYNDAFYGQGSNNILMDSINCGGYESSLFDCRFSGWGNRSLSSGHSEDASVECSNVSDIRLVNGSRSSGRIEIYNGHRWGTICGSDWDSKDARVVCKMFGYSFGLPYSGAYYGKGNNSIIMDSISCRGSESSLFNCPFTGWGIRGCSHMNDTSIECFNGSNIRLIGGNSSNEGRVEVFNGHEWGTVCDRSWDYQEANVVCKMLGYRAGVPYPAAHFGPGRGRIMMANVNCLGSETSLFDCDFPGWRENMCQHSEDASVSCHNADDFMIRLSGGSSSSNGRVEVSIGNEWGTVCNSQWNKQNADVVCKMLGYSDGIGFAVAFYGPGTGRVLMDNVNCLGTESSLLNCTYNGWGVKLTNYCPHSSDASVQCTHFNCSSKCFNNGVCTGNETCRCPSVFFGSRCENICPNQAHCMSNQTECVPGKTRCNQCVSPYIATGWTSAGPGCREPVCSPTCMNNGTCIADNVCSCTSGFLGSTCEIGGSLDAYLKPVLSPTEQRPFQALSWYRDPAISEYGRVCFLKVHVQSAAKETLMTTISRTTSGQVFGNYTTGPLDIHAGSSDSSRAACLEFRCPSSDSSPVLVQVVPVLRTAICNVSWVNPSAPSMKALQEGLPDPLNVTVTSGNNYGPKYGIYVAMGTRDKAQFSARQQCYSGKSFDVVSISPTMGTLADIAC